MSRGSEVETNFALVMQELSAEASAVRRFGAAKS